MSCRKECFPYPIHLCRSGGVASLLLPLIQGTTGGVVVSGEEGEVVCGWGRQMAWLIFGVLVSWPSHVHVVRKLDILSDKRRGLFLVDANRVRRQMEKVGVLMRRSTLPC